jgi:hypothetical protein
MQKLTIGATRPYAPSMALPDERYQSPAIVTQLQFAKRCKSVHVYKIVMAFLFGLHRRSHT